MIQYGYLSITGRSVAVCVQNVDGFRLNNVQNVFKIASGKLVTVVQEKTKRTSLYYQTSFDSGTWH